MGTACVLTLLRENATFYNFLFGCQSIRTWKCLHRHPAENATFYYNIKTGESTWEQPVELAWVKVEDQ